MNVHIANYIGICEGCGNSFVQRSKYKFTKYCNKKCYLLSGNAHRGCKHSEKTIKKLRELSLGNEKVMATTFKPGHSMWDNENVKKHWFKTGSKPSNWLGGVRTPSQKIKDDTRYKKWRRLVFERDNYTCQECFKRGTYLHPHHIKSKSKYPEFAFDVDNGQTLCVECHKKTPNYGGRALKS